MRCARRPSSPARLRGRCRASTSTTRTASYPGSPSATPALSAAKSFRRQPLQMRRRMLGSLSGDFHAVDLLLGGSPAAPESSSQSSTLNWMGASVMESDRGGSHGQREMGRLAAVKVGFAVYLGIYLPVLVRVAGRRVHLNRVVAEHNFPW